MVNRKKNLQSILLETVFHFIRATPDRQERYAEIKKRKGSNTAKVVMARQMLKIIYHVLKENRPFYSEIKQAENIRQIQPVAAAAF